MDVTYPEGIGFLGDVAHHVIGILSYVTPYIRYLSSIAIDVISIGSGLPERVNYFYQFFI